MPKHLVSEFALAPSHGDRMAFFARWLAAAILLFFTGSLAVALIIVAIWLVIPSVKGRGRDLRPLLAPTAGGWVGLIAWGLLSGRSPLSDGLLAQVNFARVLLLGSSGLADDAIGSWLTGAGPLALGLGPSFALAAAWRVSHRAIDDHLPQRVADRARSGAEHPPGGGPPRLHGGWSRGNPEVP